jgi:uncharacterized protein (TIGR03083 family)
MGTPGVGQELRRERREIHDYLSTLPAERWQQPSACEGWTVVEVAAHLAGFLSVSVAGLAARMARAGFFPPRANARDVARWTERGAPAIVAALGDDQPLGVATVYAKVGLTEAVVHHQDMRRPFGDRRHIPEARLRVALAVISRRPGTGTGARRRRKGVRLTATDIDWSIGSGPEVRGTGEAILMALSGRASAFDELSGEGVNLLTHRSR